MCHCLLDFRPDACTIRAVSSSYPERRSLRLRAFDYSRAGAYFVTVTADDRLSLFGEVVDTEMIPNANGQIVKQVWHDLTNHYSHVLLDEFGVMPDHIHAILWLSGAGRAGLKPAPTNVVRPRQPLSEVVRALKTFSARRINELRGTPGTPVWQRNYYERVVRDDRELNAIREYIQTNPLRWPLDRDKLTSGPPERAR